MGLHHEGKEKRNFAKDLWWSTGHGAKGVVEVLSDPINFPGVTRVEKTKLSDDRNGVDYWVYLSNGDQIGVDIKSRTPDFSLPEHGSKDDLTLESWSVVEKRTPGWTRNPEKHCDYILFFWPTTGRWCMIPFRPLCSVFTQHWREWRKVYETNKSESRKGNLVWHSEAVFVPRRLVLDLIEAQYGGVPAFRKTVKRAIRQIAEQMKLKLAGEES